MSPQRRDAEGRPQTAHSWESLVERQIPETMEAGTFEGLPHQGERLPIEDDAAAGEWAMAHRMLRNAGLARVRTQVARIVADANRAIERVDAEAPTACQHRRPLDPTTEAERLEGAFRQA